MIRCVAKFIKYKNELNEKINSIDEIKLMEHIEGCSFDQGLEKYLNSIMGENN